MHTVYDVDGSEADLVMVLSGKMVENGIDDFYIANFMVDDYGDPSGFLIENGDGRVSFDSDGFSERIGGKSARIVTKSINDVVLATMRIME